MAFDIFMALVARDTFGPLFVVLALVGLISGLFGALWVTARVIAALTAVRRAVRCAWGEYCRRVAGLRRCEACGGAGPVIYDSHTGKYSCRSCHTDLEFARFESRNLRRKLRFWRLRSWKDRR